MKKAICAGMAVLACLSFCACNAPQAKTPNDAPHPTENHTRSPQHTTVKKLAGGGADLGGVTEAETSSHTANEKFELDLDVDAEGNKYDPDEVNVYGQFVSPSGKLTEMPAFWYQDYERSFDALDETADFPLDGYVAQGDVSLVGKIDEIDGVKTPVGLARFSSPSGAYSNAGAILGDKSAITNLHDSVSIWLRAGSNLQTTGLYLCLYQQAGEGYIALPALSTEWKKYVFKWEDFTFNIPSGGATSLPLNSMYSGYVQTRGNETSGDVYMCDLRVENSANSNRYAVMADFKSRELANYNPNELNGAEVMTMRQGAGFKLRYRFGETGEWLYRVVVESDGVKRATYTSSVTVTENEDEEMNRGVIRVEETQKRNFVFEDGTPYVAHGMNLAYSVDAKRGSYDYDVYFPKMAAAGMNFARVWLTYLGHGVQGTEGGILGFDQRQDKAYQFDLILEMAEEYGLYLQVPFMAVHYMNYESPDHDEEFRSWDSSPYNVQNGGYLERPEQFWTDARAKEDTKKLYRYYVARWGYSRNIQSWEIMNEIGHAAMNEDGTDYDEYVAKAWAEEIGGYMHAVDPFDHLVSVSSAFLFVDQVFSAKSIDFCSIHSYVWGSAYATSAADVTRNVWETFRKPVLIGETGASGLSGETNYLADPEGLVMRQMAFTAPMGGGATGGMFFWWTQVNQHDYYKNLTPAIEYFKLLPEDFVSMDLLDYGDYTVRHTNPTVAGYMRALGYLSDDAAYVYFFDTRYNYSNRNPGTIEGMSLDVALSDGTYTVRAFDPQTGVVTNTYEATAADGKLTLTLSAWSRDLAFIIDKK